MAPYSPHPPPHSHEHNKFDDIDPRVVDDLLSKELLQLSFKDRNAIDEEIHGVHTLARDETPELIDLELTRLAIELNLLVVSCCPNNMSNTTTGDNSSSSSSSLVIAYQKSQQLISQGGGDNTNTTTYVNTDNFRLRFLRCEFFNAKKAAIRMCKFLNALLEFYGDYALQRPIQIHDFSKSELQLLKTGQIQIFPYRDKSGRPICCWVGDFTLSSSNTKERMKIALYLFYAMSDNVESQRKGVISLAWMAYFNSDIAVPSLFPTSEDATTNLSIIYDALPLRICSHHFCLPDKPHFHLLRSVMALAMSSCHKQRLKFHVGEEIELRYTVKSYGIPIELVPITNTGTIKTTYWKQWIRLRDTLDGMKAKQQQIIINGGGDYGENSNGGAANNNNFPIMIECPGSTDVIFRAGTTLICHPGNAMFQNLMESKQYEHSIASQVGKMAVIRSIIDEVKNRGGRFLQWDSRGWWTEFNGKSYVHAKVAVAVRDFKSRKIAKQNRQICNSSTSLFQNQDGKKRKLSTNGTN